MEINNTSALIGFIIKLLSVCIILFYATPKQFREVLRPKDYLTGLRWRLLALLVFTVASSVPSLVYQYLRTFGIESDSLRTIVTITSNASSLGMALLFVLIYNYKKKE